MAIKLISLFSFFMLMTEASGTVKEDFRLTIASMLEKDPEFKSVDFQTDYYEAQWKRDFSRFIIPSVALQFGMYEQHISASQLINQSKYKTASLMAGLNLFSFGTDWNLMQASRMERKAQEQRVWSKVMERESEIGRLLLSYLRDAKNLKILSGLVELKEKALKISQERYARGALSRQDLNKVKLDVSNAKAEYQVAEQTFNTTKANLVSYDIAQLPQEFPWESITKTQMKNIYDFSSPVEELPQYQLNELSMRANDYRSDALLGRMFGQFELSFSRSFYDFDDNRQWEWRAGLLYTVPLFDQFSQYTDYQQAKAARLTAEIRQRFSRKNAEQLQIAESQNLKVAYDNFRERKAALKISNQLYNDSVKQFNRGQMSVNELLVDQDRLLRTEQIANQATYQIHVSLMSFCHSRGKPVVKECF